MAPQQLCRDCLDRARVDEAMQVFAEINLEAQPPLSEHPLSRLKNRTRNPSHLARLAADGRVGEGPPALLEAAIAPYHDQQVFEITTLTSKRARRNRSDGVPCLGPDLRKGPP